MSNVVFDISLHVRPIEVLSGKVECLIDPRWPMFLWISWSTNEWSCLVTIIWVLVPLRHLSIPSLSRDRLSHSCRSSWVSLNSCFLFPVVGHWPHWIKSLTRRTTWSVACACCISIFGTVGLSIPTGSVARTAWSLVRADTQFTRPWSWYFAKHATAWRTSCGTYSVYGSKWAVLSGDIRDKVSASLLAFLGR